MVYRMMTLAALAAERLFQKKKKNKKTFAREAKLQGQIWKFAGQSFRKGLYFPTYQQARRGLSIF